MRILIIVLATSLALTACGRRGALQPPPGASVAQPQGSPGSAATAGTKKGTAEEKPDPPFVLDRLI